MQPTMQVTHTTPGARTAHAAPVAHRYNTGFGQPSPARRAMPFAIIVLLHLGLFYLLQDSLSTRMHIAPPLQMVSAMLFPAAPKTHAVAAMPARVDVRPQKTSPPRMRQAGRPLPVPSSIAGDAGVQPVGETVDNAFQPDALAATTAATAAPAAAIALPPVPARTLTSGVQYLQRPQPTYPARSRQLGEEGQVILRVLINREGRSDHVEIQKSSGYARLDDAARDAVEHALFRPHMEDGQAVPVYATVPINFKLDQ